MVVVCLWLFVLVVVCETMPLNKEQELAKSSTHRVTVVHAGPGSGKTHVIVNRIDWLLREQGVPPAEICVVCRKYIE